MRTTAIFPAILACSFFLTSATSAERVALVIGNGDYQHVSKLTNPANDAREVATRLQAGGYEVTQVVDGTVKEMGVALRTFALAGKEATTAVFFYAGHGFEVAGQNYLAPVDAELAVDENLSNDALDAALGFALEDETMPLESILTEMRKQVPGLKLVVLDCCRDNPFARTRSWAKSRSGGGGLAQVTEAQLPEGSMLVFSGEPGQQVPDGTGDHSPFTEALLGEMQSAAGAPVLTVFTGVATKVKGRQKPWIKFDGTGQSLHAFSTVALLPGSGRDDPDTNSEMAALREQLAAAEKAREEAERKVMGNQPKSESEGIGSRLLNAIKGTMAGDTKPNPVTPSTPPAPPTMVKTDTAPEPSFPASRGMQGNVAGEVREFGGIEMVWCPPGEFWMGSPEDEADREKNETLHRVTLTQGFWMAKTETTQGQWEGLMEIGIQEMANKAPILHYLYGEGKDHPMYYVNYSDADEYLVKMNAQHSLTGGWIWALPTEAQWEYACRAGTETAYAGDLDEMAWHGSNSSIRAHPVGTKTPNAWGLHDMHGNIREMSTDWFDSYPRENVVDPKGPTTGKYRMGRGGSWEGSQDPSDNYRSAARYLLLPDDRNTSTGFRVVIVPPR